MNSNSGDDTRIPCSSSREASSNSSSNSKEKILVLDGGTGTHLRALGADFGGSPLWASQCIITAPELVRQTHKDFFDAGADVATTVTYQLCSAACAKLGYAPSDAAGLVQQAIHLADEARQQTENPQKKLVLLSCGSYGASLGGGAEYKGEFSVSEDELRAYHRWRIEAALREDSGRLVDGVIFETLPMLAEAKALLPMLREFPELRGKVWLAFSCKSSTELCSGENFRSCASEVLRLDAHDKYLSGIGVNCCPIAFVQELVCWPPLLHWLVSPTCPPSVSLAKTRDVVGEQLRVLCYPNNEHFRNVREETRAPFLTSSSTAQCQTRVTDSIFPENSRSGTNSSHGGYRRPHSGHEGCTEEGLNEQGELVSAKSSESETALQEGKREEIEQVEQKQRVCGVYHKPGKWGSLAASARQWLRSGEPMAIGGCCGTAPEDIRQIVEAVHSFEKSPCL